MKKVIAIQRHNPEILQVTLQLTTSCPYACSYCPDSLHTGTNQTFDLAGFKKFFTKFSNRQVVLTITGGECTMHPQFVDVLITARELGHKICVDTNLVRTERFYQEVGPMADVWNITLHPSQHKLDIQKITTLTDNSFVVVYVMMDPRHWNMAVNWFNQLIAVKNIKLIPLQTISNWAGAEFEAGYTEQQIDWLQSTPSKFLLTDARLEQIKQTHNWLMLTDADVVYDNNTVEVLDGYMLIKNNLNKFQGWRCSAGSENISINADGTVAWANCGIKMYDSLDIDINELSTPLICDRESCNCITDIRATKCIN